MDLNPWLLACKNGVLNLQTGELRPGRPDDYISKACPTEWKGLDCPAPKWEKWLVDILGGKQEHEEATVSGDEAEQTKRAQQVAAFLQRVFGYGITGLRREHIFLALVGRGRNGKGTMLETLMEVLGPMAGPIPSEMLLDQGRTRSSAGPSPDIMTLRGLRLAIASETDEGRRFSPSRVKWLSGGDTLVGRYPHDKRPITFRPTHTLILMTNHEPQAPGGDFAFWERILLVPFPFSYVDRAPVAANERPVIKGLVEEFRAEASGILAWLVRGCLEYQRLGALNPPETITKATLEYQRAEDVLGHFFDEHCKLGEGLEEEATHLYDNYSAWYQQKVSSKGISQTKFGRIMRHRFKKDKGKSGRIVYFGIELIKEVDKPAGSKKGPEGSEG